jgi:hypothetical protein
VRIIALKSYRSGYLGFLDEPDEYVFFTWARNGRMKRVVSYDKADFFNKDHFLSIITKFVSRKFFLEEALEIDTFSAKTLDRICREKH